MAETIGRSRIEKAMSWATISTALKALVVGVTGVPEDNVYERIAMYNDAQEFKDLFFDGTNSRFLGVEIYTTRDEDDLVAHNTIHTEHDVVIRCFIGIKDRNQGNDTYTTLRNLVEDIREVLRKNLTVSGTCVNADMPAMAEISPGLRQSVYTWECAINWTVYERTTVTENLS